MRETKETEPISHRFPFKKQEGAPIRVLTSLSAILLTVTLVMGMLLFNSVSTLDGIQNRLETMDLQIEQIYSSVTSFAGQETVMTQAPADGIHGGEIVEDAGQ